MATKKPRNKPYIRQDLYIQKYNYLSKLMRNNSLLAKDVELLKWGLQMTFFCAELLRNTTFYEHDQECLNESKLAFERALNQAIKHKDTYSDENNILHCPDSTNIKIHKLTREKIIVFCERFKHTHKLVFSMGAYADAKIREKAEFMANMFLQLRDTPLNLIIKD